MLHKLRGAMVAPERELLKGEVEIDEFFLGGYEEGLKGGRQRGKKTLCGAAIEVRGRGSGRLRLEVLANSRATTLEEFTKTTTAPGTTVHTDGLFSYSALPKLGYDHRPRKAQASPTASTCCLGCIARSATWRPGCTAPSRRVTRASARLPRRVCLPPQPPRHPDGRLPDTARARRPARADHLPRHYRPSRVTATWSEPAHQRDRSLRADRHGTCSTFPRGAIRGG